MWKQQNQVCLICVENSSTFPMLWVFPIEDIQVKLSGKGLHYLLFLGFLFCGWQKQWEKEMGTTVLILQMATVWNDYRLNPGSAIFNMVICAALDSLRVNIAMVLCIRYTLISKALKHLFSRGWHCLKSLTGVTFLEEVCHWAGFQSSKMHIISSSLPLILY